MRKLYLRRAYAFGLFVGLVCGNSHVYAQAAESELAVQLKLTPTLYAVSSVKLEALQVSAPLINYEGLTRALSQAPQCDALSKSAVAGVLRMAAVVNQVICNRLGVREGFGLTEQARAALELAESQRQPSLNLSVGFEAERGGRISCKGDGRGAVRELIIR